MTEYTEKPRRVRGSTTDGVSPSRGKVKIQLAKKDGSEDLVLTLINIFCLPNSFSNLVSLDLLNNAGIYYHNEDQTLYNQSSKKILAFAERYKTSFLLHPLNLSSAAVNLLREYEVYKGPEANQMQSNKLHLILWHQRLGHLNFIALKKYLTHHNIKFINDAEGFICDSCERAKAKKQYNCSPQPIEQSLISTFTQTLLDQLCPSVLEERYFFTFTNNYTRTTKTYTAKRKSKWLKCLKAFYNLTKIRTKQERPTERLQSDYGFELQNRKVDKWLTNQGIIFEPSVPYSQEKNGVSKRIGRTIMEMVRATILEGGIDDTLWPKVVLVMTHIKNLCPTQALEKLISLAKMEGKDLPNKELPNLHHFRVLGSTVYMFLHKEERTLKSAKWDAGVLKGKLVGFNGHTIYKVHIKDQNKVIRVKDLRIFEDTSVKANSTLPDFNEKPTFDATQIPDEQGPSDESSASKNKKVQPKPPQKPKKIQAGRNTTARTSEEENEPKAKSRAGRTLKPTPKRQEEAESTRALITELTLLLGKDWENDQVSAFLTTYKENEDKDSKKVSSIEQDPLHILATVIHKANTINPSEFTSSIQLNIKEPETYEQAISGPHVQ